ncbi:MAG TPA: glycoside hydrolase family 97 catalytic domain-containing protein [Puia sp.]|nr:glycoside hydrolase family 97 catalytic domain-containing protein [Puia sp.]
MRFGMLLLTLVAAISATAQSSVRICSPNGKLRASVFVDSFGHHLAWSLDLDGKPVVLPSALGIDLSGIDLGQDVSLGAAGFSTHNSSYPWSGVHCVATDHYRDALIPVKGTRGLFTLECRIFNDGFAFRYWVRSHHPALVTGESSSWHLPGGSRVWYQENVFYYEGLHYSTLIGELGDKRLGPPVTFQTPDGLYGSITEAALYNYSGMSLRSDTSGTLHAAFINDPEGWTPGGWTPDGLISDGTFASPWRVVLASATLDGLVNSDIIPDLNPAPDSLARTAGGARGAGRVGGVGTVGAAQGAGGARRFHGSQGARTAGGARAVVSAQGARGAQGFTGVSWIRPGRAVWSYFVHDNVTTLALEKAYVDKAAALGFEYSIVDAGWDSSWPNAYDSLSSLVRYAGARHVRIFVWKSYASLKDDSIRRAFFADMRRLGVAGLKIDYIDKEGIDQVRFYEKALRDALAFQLLIDFHGADKPTGYNRRFPNELTREGIYGQEWRTYTPQGSINNAIIPFTRFLAGPADYTPGVFNSALAYGTSRAQQLALTVIYNSPLLCWADDPSVYLASPAAAIIRRIPTTWDETRVLAPSRIGELVAFARRKGNDWYLGIINAGDEKRLDLPLSFLGKGAFRGEIISDDLTSSDRVLHSVAGFTAGDTLPVLLQAKGGFVARFVRSSEAPLSLVIRPAGGYLQGPQKVRIVTKGAAPGAIIRYTIDGSLPDLRSPAYTGELTISEPAVVRARVFMGRAGAGGAEAGGRGAHARAAGTGAGGGGASAGGARAGRAHAAGVRAGGKTAGADTADVVAQFLAAPAPVATPAGGIFIGRQAVWLSSRMPGEIRYTTDGSDPNASSPLFRDSILLDASTMLKSRVFFAAGGASAISDVRFQKVAPDEAVSTGRTGVDGWSAGGGVQGLRYAYYEGKWDSMPAFGRLTPMKFGSVLSPVLDSIATRPDEYGLRFTGWITIPETGVYTFYTVSDDGSELYIGDQKVVDNDGCHGDLERSGERALMAGKHRFTLDYFQNSSGQTLQVFIKGPHLEKQAIPAAMFATP